MSRWAEIRTGAVRYEDGAVLVLDKPAGISVTGERHDTDLVRLAQQDGEELFPVHRIDKATSGIILFAKELRFHGDLTRQFNKRTVEKTYLALTRATPLPGLPAALPEHGTIDLPLGVGRKNRVRVAGNREDITVDADGRHWTLTDPAAPAASASSAAPAAPAADPTASAASAGPAAPAAGPWASGAKKSYPSRTGFVRLWAGGGHAALAVSPVTGRRHQIRVHLAWIGHPIVGDPLFGDADAARCALHSWRLAFDAAWDGGRRLTVTAEPGPDFWGPLGDAGPEANAAVDAQSASGTALEKLRRTAEAAPDFAVRDRPDRQRPNRQRRDRSRADRERGDRDSGDRRARRSGPRGRRA